MPRHTVIDSQDIGPVESSLEQVVPGNHLYVRLRPHQPTAYFAAHDYSVILTVEQLHDIVDQLKRCGKWQD